MDTQARMDAMADAEVFVSVAWQSLNYAAVPGNASVDYVALGMDGDAARCAREAASIVFRAVPGLREEAPTVTPAETT